MRFRFVGNGRDDPSEVSFGGIVFPIGEWVNVDDPWAQIKLIGNGHFESAAEAVTDERASLTALAKQMGVAVDGRWSLARLRKEIKAHGENTA